MLRLTQIAGVQFEMHMSVALSATDHSTRSTTDQKQLGEALLQQLLLDPVDMQITTHASSSSAVLKQVYIHEVNQTELASGPAMRLLHDAPCPLQLLLRAGVRFDRDTASCRRYVAIAAFPACCCYA
jgi:hypothetical protein